MPITVTKPSLPPLDELLPYLEEIWHSAQVSNCGPMHETLEASLEAFLGVANVSLFCNATAALMVAQKVLDIRGEVITTPYTFAATAHAIDWVGNVPVFVDIDPDSLCLDPDCVEAAITDRTRAILPLHCYGNMCDVTRIAEIAAKYELKVIYDACHSFGVEDDTGSALKYGDLSVVSFHATKVFNTFEGGALITNQAHIKQMSDRLKNFGFIDEVTVEGSGINGKMSEFNAALGLLQLQYFEERIRRRSVIDNHYRERLSSVEGLHLLSPVGQAKRNFSYFPIFVSEQYPESRDRLYQRLKGHDIFCRRYFYPLVTEFPAYRHLPSTGSGQLPFALKASREVICLPLYPDLDVAEVDRICDLIDRGDN